LKPSCFTCWWDWH